MTSDRVGPQCLAKVLVCLALVLWAFPAHAQLMHFDPIPFFTPADSTSRLALVVDADRFSDSKYGWTLNRILVTVVLPAGDGATYFIRLPHATFDTGTMPLASRWPDVLGPAGQDGWPADSRIASLAKIETGVTGPLVPGLAYGVALGLPTGTDRLFPFSAMNIPLRLQLRKTAFVAHEVQVGAKIGYLLHMDSGRHELNGEAFPGGYQLGASLTRLAWSGRRAQLTWDYRNEGGRRSQLVGIAGWAAWGESSSLALKVAREFQGTIDRPAEWYFTVSWRFDGSRAK